jgi:outer membrane protein W
MKKFIYTAAAVFASLTAFAQADTDIERTFTIGPAVGYGHSFISGVGYDASFSSSWNAGVTMNYSQWENIGFSADILYSLEGGFYEMNDGTEIDIDLHYLRVPVKFAYFFMDQEDRFRPKITVGPSFGFLIDERTEIDGDEDRVNSNLTREHETIDLGGQASLGFNYRMGERTWLNTDLYYYHGFLDIDNVGDLHQYNSNMGIRVGVAFGL